MKALGFFKSVIIIVFANNLVDQDVVTCFVVHFCKLRCFRGRLYCCTSTCRLKHDLSFHTWENDLTCGARNTRRSNIIHPGDICIPSKFTNFRSEPVNTTKAQSNYTNLSCACTWLWCTRGHTINVY